MDSGSQSLGCKLPYSQPRMKPASGLWQSEPACLKAVNGVTAKETLSATLSTPAMVWYPPGIYVGIRWNSLLGIHNFKVASDGEFANRQAWYKRFCEKMVEELAPAMRFSDLVLMAEPMTHEGDGPDVEPIVNKYQPQTCLFYHNMDRADFPLWEVQKPAQWDTPVVPRLSPCSHHKTY